MCVLPFQESKSTAAEWLSWRPFQSIKGSRPGLIQTRSIQFLSILGSLNPNDKCIVLSLWEMETSTSSLNLYQDYVDFNSNQTSDGVTFYDVDDVGSWNYSLFEFDSALFWNAYIRYHNLDPRHRWKMPQYYSLAYQIIGTIFQGIIFSVGK